MSQEHIVPVKTYIGIFVTLLCLTALTTGVAFIDLGAMNTVIALVIAATKMLLVMLVFMHLKYSSKLTKLAVLAAFFWLALLLTLTFSDVFSRNWTPIPSGWGPSISVPAPQGK
jgi:cytochrome c oxidase subunit IV